MVLALVFAFVMVAASTFLAIPVMLYGLGLAEDGWTWMHAALFAAMVASTDAVAGAALLAVLYAMLPSSHPSILVPKLMTV